MSAKESAIMDILDDLRKESKSFIVFCVELNPVINNIVSEYIKAQENI